MTTQTMPAAPPDRSEQHGGPPWVSKMIARLIAVVTGRFHRSMETIGRSTRLTASVIKFTVHDTLTLNLPLREVVAQMLHLLKVTTLPALLMAVPIGAEISVQVGGIMDQVGANSLAGAASGLGVVGQGAPMAAGLLMSGAAASAIASDLGSRAIREEIDAMRVVGVDPVQRLVVPRVVAMIVIAPALCIVIISAGVAAGLAISANINDVVPGSFWQSFGAFATPTDLVFSVIKSVVFAGIVVVISSLRGLEAHGGPKGVANAVNASVVLSVFCIFMMNLVISQFQTMFFPSQLA